MAWLGPAIGPGAFEVGGEVREAFVAGDAIAAQAFESQTNGKWLCDIYALARLRLDAVGIHRVAGPRSGVPGMQGTGPRSGVPGMQSTVTNLCTVADAENFFSYRRDGTTGRMPA
jgi:copper oxidase (laccase) domain-containing protein